MYFKDEKPEQVTTPSCSKTHYQKTASSSCTISSQMSGEELFHLEKPTICSFSVTVKATGHQNGTPIRRHLPSMP